MLQRMLVGAVGVLGAIAPGIATAQIGFRPQDSPYRDIRIRQTVTVSSAFLAGGRGEAGVGPSAGLLGGIRWDFHVGGAATVYFGGSAGQFERNLINPDEPPETRALGTANQTILFAEGGLNLILTGRKTWHGLAPYVGAGLGMAFGGAVPEDSSGFSFKNKFHIGPALGVRWFLNRRIHIRVEGRNYLWRLTYPNRFFNVPASDPEADPVLDGRVTTTSQWVHHPTLRLGLGYSIRL